MDKTLRQQADEAEARIDELEKQIKKLEEERQALISKWARYLICGES